MTSPINERSVKKVAYLLCVSMLVYVLLSTRISIKISTQRRTLLSLNTQDFFLVSPSIPPGTSNLLINSTREGTFDVKNATTIPSVKPHVDAKEVVPDHRHITWDSDLQGPPSQVLVLAYQRTGSSFLGDLFNIHEDVFYWFEPLDGVYAALFGTSHGWAGPQDIYVNKDGTSRTISPVEHRSVVNALRNIFSCDMTTLPPEVPMHSFSWNFLSHNKDLSALTTCLTKNKVRTNTETCRKQNLKQVCPSKFGLNLQVTDRCHQALMSTNSTAKVLNQTSILESKKTLHQYRVKQRMQHHAGVLYQGSIYKRRGLGKGVNEAVSLYKRCRNRLLQQGSHCVRDFKAHCNTHQIRAIKTVRARMTHAKDLLERFPNLTVIHTFRDPRGVVNSRYKNVFQSLYGTNNMVKEAEIYCKLLEQDIRLRRELEKKYPGRITHVIYDQLATQPEQEAQRLLDFTGVRWTPHIQSWLYNNTKGRSITKKGLIIQKNSTQYVSKWRKRISRSVLHGINVACKGLYKLVDNVWPDTNI